jgi:hypothetical protein
MFPPGLAAALRDRDHNVLAIAERVDMRSMTDADVFAWVLAAPCWLLTENVGNAGGVRPAVHEFQDVPPVAGQPRATDRRGLPVAIRRPAHAAHR